MLWDKVVWHLQPRRSFASETEGRRHANEMNLRNRENHGPQSNAWAGWHETFLRQPGAKYFS